MNIKSPAEAVELVRAKPFAAFHLRIHPSRRTVCGRPAMYARVLDRMQDFDPLDPDTRMCQTCLRLGKVADVLT